MGAVRQSHLLKATIAILAIILVLYGKALLTSDVLSQTDLLVAYPPWNAHRPADFQGPRNPLLSDQSFHTIPCLYFMKHSLSTGKIPLWNPHIMAGMPFLANMQSAVFFPIYWLVFLTAVPDALEWICAAKIILAFLGFYLFCLKALDLRPLPAFAGGVIYALCGFNTVWLFYTLTNVSCLAGWLLLSIDLVIRQGRIRNILLLAIVVALIIAGGHPETVLHLFVIACLYLVFTLWRYRSARIHIAATKLILSTLLGVALSSVVLIPFIELGLQSGTLFIRTFAGHPFNPWFSAVTALIPNLFGNPVAGFYAGPVNYNEIANFASVSSLILAVLALLWARHKAGAYFGITVLIVCGMVAYGISPVFEIFHLLPLYRHTLNPRMVLGFSMGLAVLAAIGLDSVFEIEDTEVWKKIRWWTGGTFVTLILLLNPFAALALISVSNNKARLVYMATEMIAFFLTLVAIFALITWLVNFPSRRWLVCFLWVALICIEMIHFAAGYNPTIPRAQYAYDYLPASIQFLKSKGVDRFVGVDLIELAANSSMVYGIFDFRGLDCPEPMNYGEYFYNLVDSGSRLNITHSINQWTPAAVRALGNAGVRYFAHKAPLDYPGMKLVHSGDIYIYEYERAVPRAYIPRSIATVASNDEALSRIKSPEFDAKVTTFITDTGAGAALPPSWPAETGVKITHYEPEFVALRATSASPAILVLTDLAMPGWHAYVNGRPTRIYTANAMFRAVEIPSGESRVEFKYQPRSYVVGKWISLCALAVTLLLALPGASRRLIH